MPQVHSFLNTHNTITSSNNDKGVIKVCLFTIRTASSNLRSDSDVIRDNYRLGLCIKFVHFVRSSAKDRHVLINRLKLINLMRSRLCFNTYIILVKIILSQIFPYTQYLFICLCILFIPGDCMSRNVVNCMKRKIFSKLIVFRE